MTGTLALLPKGWIYSGGGGSPGAYRHPRAEPAKKHSQCTNSLLRCIKQRFNNSEVEAFLPGSNTRFRNPRPEPELIWEAHKSRETNKCFLGGLCKVPRGTRGLFQTRSLIPSQTPESPGAGLHEARLLQQRAR